jgi:hypothetical protein
MKTHSRRGLGRGAVAIAGALALGLALSACSSAGGGAETGNADDIAKALDTATPITVVTPILSIIVAAVVGRPQTIAARPPPRAQGVVLGAELPFRRVLLGHA